MLKTISSHCHLCLQVYFAGLGCLKNVRAALCRGRALKCTRCGRPGATIGCRVDRCPKTYHLVSCLFSAVNVYEILSVIYMYMLDLIMLSIIVFCSLVHELIVASLIIANFL